MNILELGRTLIPDLMRKYKNNQKISFKELALDLIAIIRDEDPNSLNIKKPAAVKRDSSALI